MEANYKDPSFDNELIMKMKQANPLASYTSGKVWLLYQALTGYEIFTGERPDLARMTAVI
jgi:shikimate 5-dehydrogenase